MKGRILYVRVSEPVDRVIADTAEKERRSMSFVASELLTEALTADGKLPIDERDRERD